MPRLPRYAPAGHVYHVLNRSAGRIALFRRPGDYEAFFRVILEAQAKVPLPLLAFCVMNNHWHFVCQPQTDTQLTDFFRWLAHTHAMRWRVSRRTVGWGHLYQGRFKAFPVQTGAHFLRVCRYVERNPLNAGLVPRAQDYPWSSLHVRAHGPADLAAILAPWPRPRPADWTRLVNTPLTRAELSRLRASIDRGQPYGDPAWTRTTAATLNIEHTLRPKGRPKTTPARAENK